MPAENGSLEVQHHLHTHSENGYLDYIQLAKKDHMEIQHHLHTPAEIGCLTFDMQHHLHTLAKKTRYSIVLRCSTISMHLPRKSVFEEMLHHRHTPT